MWLDELSLLKKQEVIVLSGISIRGDTSFEACDNFMSSCDKVRIIKAWRQNDVLYHILNTDWPDTFPFIHSSPYKHLAFLAGVVPRGEGVFSTPFSQRSITPLSWKLDYSILYTVNGLRWIFWDKENPDQLTMTSLWPPIFSVEYKKCIF